MRRQAKIGSAAVTVASHTDYLNPAIVHQKKTLILLIDRTKIIIKRCTNCEIENAIDLVPSIGIA